MDRPSTARHRAVALLLLTALVSASCRQADKPLPPWHQETAYRWRELDVPRGKPGFMRMEAGRTGIRFENTVSDSALLGNRMLGQGAGVALGDVDGDGLVDVFLARTEGCNALNRNLGGWRFEDVAKPAGVAACDRYSSGAAFADVDGNGTLDIVVSLKDAVDKQKSALIYEVAGSADNCMPWPTARGNDRRDGFVPPNKQ